MKDSLKNKLKTRYEESSQNVPNYLWERIETELDENKRETKLPLFNYKWISLAAVFLLFISLGFIYFNSNTKIEQPKKANLTAKIVKPNPKNSKKEIINNDNLNRGELALQKPINEKVETRIVKVSNKKISNKINLKNNIIETKSTDSQVVTKNIIPEKPPIAVAAKESKENVKYTSAKDLLFGYELEKSNSEMEKSHSKLGVSEIKKPKEITVLGIKIYSDESGN